MERKSQRGKPDQLRNQKLKEIPHSILVAEFEYLANTAIQAGEEHARVPQYYFMALGSSLASLLSVLEIPQKYVPWTYWGFALIFFILSGFGWLTVKQLISFRIAWLQSSLAMDEIKEYYINHFQQFNLQSAIQFRIAKLPDAYKPGSIGQLLASATSLMSSLSLLGGLTFLGLALSDFIGLKNGAMAGIFLALLSFRMQRRHYRKALENSAVQTKIKERKKEIQEEEKEKQK
jgi:hypothetical protein